MRRIIFALIVCASLVLPLCAQDSPKGFTASAGGGISFPIGTVKTRTSTGFVFVASAGPRFNPRFSLVADFSLQYTTLINSFQSPDPNVTISEGSLLRIWSLTPNPVFQFIKQERFSAYATGGYGLYNRKLLLAAPGLAPISVCDEFWNVCVNNASGPTITGNTSAYKGGFNVGGGFNFGIHHKFFVDGRYHHMFTNGFATELIPLTFGVRW
jgi:hypothetical protein